MPCSRNKRPCVRKVEGKQIPESCPSDIHTCVLAPKLKRKATGMGCLGRDGEELEVASLCPKILETTSCMHGGGVVTFELIFPMVCAGVETGCPPELSLLEELPFFEYQGHC